MNSDWIFTILVLVLVGGCVGDNYIDSTERIETLKIEKGYYDKK